MSVHVSVAGMKALANGLHDSKHNVGNGNTKGKYDAEKAGMERYDVTKSEAE